LSFGVYGTIGNALSLTKKSWLNMKQVWHPSLAYQRDWKVPLKDQEWGLVDQFRGLLLKNIKRPLQLEPD
jgi:hypothetical protein